MGAAPAAFRQEHLPGHLQPVLGNGLTETERKEAIIHLAFYAGWPRAMSTITVAKQAMQHNVTARSPRTPKDDNR